jgi:hypothetical protein
VAARTGLSQAAVSAWVDDHPAIKASLWVAEAVALTVLALGILALVNTLDRE